VLEDAFEEIDDVWVLGKSEAQTYLEYLLVSGRIKGCDVREIGWLFVHNTTVPRTAMGGQKDPARRITDLRALGFSISYQKKTESFTIHESYSTTVQNGFRKNITSSARKALSNECQSCGGKTGLTVDHKIPHDIDPDQDSSNPDIFMRLCSPCQNRKQNVCVTKCGNYLIKDKSVCEICPLSNPEHISASLFFAAVYKTKPTLYDITRTNN
jgi:5-methylcytosine-specific restriction endonuclease McrA